MAPQAPVVLAPPEVLNINFDRGMLDYVADDAHSLQHWLANARLLAALVEQNTFELKPRADFSVAIIYTDLIAFAHSVLSRAIFKHCVHRSFPARISSVVK
jgi:hypothetical protein